MKIVTWNVNGLKAITRKGSLDEVLKYDVIMLQEIRTSDLPLDLLFSGLTIESFSAKKKGYSGVMTLTRYKPINVIKGLNVEEFDEEGRVLTLEFEKLFLINSYFPRAGDELKRLDFKIKFDKTIEEFMMKLRERKPVIICGDFNAVRDRKDSSFWDEREPALTPQEREWLNHVVNDLGFIDAYKLVNPSKNEFTWRSYRFKWKAMRIDYCLVSSELKNEIKNCEVLKIEGSDHYPLLLELNIESP
ncbi:exodeoxyribonuclease III [Acidianus ambivalens]|uniref:Exodeoxyribonuclease III n=1 Tax=Acidianus ambivalens TaxID=2283 RepID=A0A650CUX5_ACIAM|nr:exodeoxyribonuclease III [Acidianus ambivalens]MQL56194.1 exodeoxyribonuclease III [Acidianus ambivalens]QGR21267.1 exodeoxyribonuclease III [Acidianus ambivalens]